jgi:hypothetical protein
VRAVAVLDSVTQEGDLAGAVVLAASHGGRITAARAVENHWAAVIAHDASVGLDEAGIESLSLLDRAVVPAATVGGRHAPIGDGRRCYSSGRLTHVNGTARAVGLHTGQSAIDAMARLAAIALPTPTAIDVTVPEPRCVELDRSRVVWLVGSVSEVDADRHSGVILVTGSHAELLGDRPDTACKAAPSIAVFNDAGSRRCSRLPVLDERGIAAVAVAVDSARIGDAASTLATGRISVVNDEAAALGAVAGDPVQEWLRRA